MITLFACLFFTTGGFLLRHFMAKKDNLREASQLLTQEAYILALELDVASLAFTVKAQGESIHALRDESSDIVHESDLLRESVTALKRANESLLNINAKEASKAPKAKAKVTGKRVRITK